VTHQHFAPSSKFIPLQVANDRMCYVFRELCATPTEHDDGNEKSTA